MGSKLSSASDSETLAETATTGVTGSVSGLNRHQRRHHYHRHHTPGTRSRARSFGGVTQREAGTASSAALDIDVGGLLDLERPRSRSVIAAGSVPVRVFSFGMIILFFCTLCTSSHLVHQYLGLEDLVHIAAAGQFPCNYRVWVHFRIGTTEKNGQNTTNIFRLLLRIISVNTCVRKCILATIQPKNKLRSPTPGMTYRSLLISYSHWS